MILKLGIFLNLILGILIRLIRKDYFFGDATQFYNTYHHYLKTFNFCSSYFFSLANTVFVSSIYNFLGDITPYLINSIFLFLFFIFLKRKLINRSSSFKNYKIILILLLSLILYPPFIIRFTEPSREYLLFISLFIIGASYTEIGFNKINKLFSALILLIRPVYLPIYCLWLFPLDLKKIIKKKFIIIPISLVILSLLYLNLDLNFINGFCSGLRENYNAFKTNYQPSNNFFENNIFKRVVLNIFGDINSFLSNKYSIFTRFFYLITYIDRLFILFLLLKIFGIKTSRYLIYASFTIALFSQFPHPRYLEPYYYLLSGFLIFNSSNRYKKISDKVPKA